MSSLILNEKGAVAYRSTFLSLVDMFGLNLQNGKDIRNMTLQEFEDMFDICHKAYLSDPNQYISLLGYRRSIEHIGQKMLYYIMMYIVRVYNNDSTLYRNILDWSHKCKKDLLRMARIYNKGKNYNSSPPELQLYSDYIFDFIYNKSLDSSDMIFKYIGTGHFDTENRVIKQLLNDKLSQFNLPIYTNSSLRKFYSSQKSKLHLGDCLLRGEKEDGSPIDEEYTVNYLKKMSTKAFKKIMNTISKTCCQDEYCYCYKKVLHNSYLKLRKEIEEKKFTVKATGVNPITECYNYFEGENTDMTILESMLTKKLTDLQKRMKGVENKDNKIDIVIDNSGSMDGEPIQTAYYIALMLHKIYNIPDFIVFNTDAKRVHIDYLNGDWKNTIKSLYSRTEGTTQLHTIFPLLKDNDNTTIIITDGDCDPTSDGQNPFQKALSMFPKRKFIVWNVKQKKLCFPYSALDERVGYITGNETGIIEAVFRNFPTTPVGLLNACLEDFKCPHKIVKDDRVINFSQNEKKSLYHSIQNNIPIITTGKVIKQAEVDKCDDNDDNDDSDYSD